MKRVAFAVLLLASGTAHAFPTGNQFDLDPVMNDGAGGIAFDGAPRWTNHACDVCHTNAPHLIGMRLESDHPEVFTTGWTAGMQYHMRVVLLNEHAAVQYQPAGDNCGFALATYSPCDQNGFSLEVTDGNGGPVGSYAAVVNNACAAAGAMVPNDVDVRIMTDGKAVTHNGAHHAQVAWDFCWTAPAAGAGILTAYVATVDGNGGDGTMNFPADTTGDDVAIGQVPMPEVGAAPPPSQTGGCSAGPDAGAGALLLIALVSLVRRRRFAALLAIVALAGCSHVRPRERETLARKNMKFSPDPIEDELDLHMQEAREGSSGGYGSSGGGCGCN